MATLTPRENELAEKAVSNIAIAFSVRALALGEPITTTISLRPLREALATTLKPEAHTKPVFMPSAPG